MVCSQYTYRSCNSSANKRLPPRGSSLSMRLSPPSTYCATSATPSNARAALGELSSISLICPYVLTNLRLQLPVSICFQSASRTLPLPSDSRADPSWIDAAKPTTSVTASVWVLMNNLATLLSWDFSTGTSVTPSINQRAPSGAIGWVDCASRSLWLVVPVFLLYPDEAIKVNLDCLNNNLKRVITSENVELSLRQNEDQFNRRSETDPVMVMGQQCTLLRPQMESTHPLTRYRFGYTKSAHLDRRRARPYNPTKALFWIYAGIGETDLSSIQ